MKTRIEVRLIEGVCVLNLDLKGTSENENINFTNELESIGLVENKPLLLIVNAKDYQVTPSARLNAKLVIDRLKASTLKFIGLIFITSKEDNFLKSVVKKVEENVQIVDSKESAERSMLKAIRNFKTGV